MVLVHDLPALEAEVLFQAWQEVVRDDALRAHLCEEMADVFMYLCDVMLCCGVSAEEFEKAYRAKADRNLKRDFVGEHAHYLEK